MRTNSERWLDTCRLIPQKPDARDTTDAALASATEIPTPAKVSPIIQRISRASICAILASICAILASSVCVGLGETRIEVVVGDEITLDRLARIAGEFLRLLLAEIDVFETAGDFQGCRSSREERGITSAGRNNNAERSVEMMVHPAGNRALTAIGLMSGTSLDGIDAALLTTDGETSRRARAGGDLALPGGLPRAAAGAARPRAGAGRRR